MGTPESLKKAQKAAWSPEARAKAAATRKRNLAAKAALERSPLLKHAKLTKGAKKVKKVLKRDHLGVLPKRGIPLDMIPDPPKRTPKKAGPSASKATRQEVVLALLKYLNDE